MTIAYRFIIITVGSKIVASFSLICQVLSGFLDSIEVFMRTVHKALNLLKLFSVTESEMGLSEMARRARLDKATTHRLLTSLQDHGFVEQHPESRKYRLGTEPLHLARIREASFPVSTVIQPVMDSLTAETGETSHVSLLAGDRLAVIGAVESPRSSRVSLDNDSILPFHATASGIVFLAFADPDWTDRVLTAPLAGLTDQTVTSPDRLRKLIAAARRDGVAEGDQGYEAEVFGIAAPLFDRTGQVCGAVAVATPSSRVTAKLKKTIKAALRPAAIAITQGMGGVVHPTLLAKAA